MCSGREKIITFIPEFEKMKFELRGMPSSSRDSSACIGTSDPIWRVSALRVEGLIYNEFVKSIISSEQSSLKPSLIRSRRDEITAKGEKEMQERG